MKLSLELGKGRKMNYHQNTNRWPVDDSVNWVVRILFIQEHKFKFSELKLQWCQCESDHKSTIRGGIVRNVGHPLCWIYVKWFNCQKERRKKQLASNIQTKSYVTKYFKYILYFSAYFKSSNALFKSLNSAAIFFNNTALYRQSVGVAGRQ